MIQKRKVKIRQCYIKNNLCYIPLNNGQEAITDAIYFDKISKYNWHIHSSGIVRTNINKQAIALYKLLCKDFIEVKYKNNNKLDIRFENLIGTLERKCYIKDNLCYIPLQNGKEAYTDKDYFDIVSKYNWYVTKNGYAATHTEIKAINLQKFLFPEYTRKIKFINNNPLDCRKENIYEINRQCFIKDNLCYIPLANCDKFAVCDADRFDEVNQHNWNYAKRCISTNIKCKQVKLHKFLYPQWKIIDHINRDILNNTSKNLREVTTQQNNMNKDKLITNKSGYKGVSQCCWNKNKWQAQIKFNSKQHNLGAYDTKEQAALAYNEKAKELFGEYAYLNVIGVENK